MLTRRSEGQSQIQLYQALCRALSDRASEVDWGEFGASDWQAFVAMARLESVAPMLYWTVRRGGLPAGAPPEAMAALGESYYASTAYNVLLFDELDRVLDAFKVAQIRTIVLKGAALAAGLYPEMGLRPMTDLDLLVQPDRFRQSYDLLTERLGYTECSEEPARDFDLIFHHARCLKRAVGPGLLLELHQELVATAAYRYHAPSDWFWDHAEASIWHRQGIEALTLSPTAQLLYSATHAMMQHGGGSIPMIWLYDMHLMLTLQSDRLDWELLLARAGETGWSAGLLAALKRIRRDFGSPVPSHVLESLVRQTDPKTLALVERKITPTKTRSQAEWNRMASLSIAGKGRMALAMLFPSKLYMRRRYDPKPAWLLPLYYPYRWLDVVRDGLLTLSKNITSRLH